MNISFYKIYLKKLQACQDGDSNAFELHNDELFKLGVEDKHPAAMHLMAKESYKIALNMMSGKYRKRKEETMHLSYSLFLEAINANFVESYYYAAEMLENGDAPGGVNLKQAIEFYKAAASYDNPRAMFKLSQYYKKGLVLKKDIVKEIYYMKRSAELG